MRTLVIIATSFFVGVLTSCEKDAVSTQPVASEVEYLLENCPGGGDDEDPWIHGGLIDAGQYPISGAAVKLFRGGFALASTNSGMNGKFCFHVEPGTYSIVSYANGYQNDTTNVFTLNSDTTFVRTMN